MKSPSEVIDLMMNNDHFSKWLGISRSAEGLGFCTLECTVTKDMLNGFGIAHGGITYSLADSALAFASNSYGLQAVSVETSISHTKKVNPGDILSANCKELSRSTKIGVYETHVTNQLNETVALFKGTVYISSKPW